MSKKLIDCYKEWMKEGVIDNRRGSIGDGGLCNAVPKEYLETLHFLAPPNSQSWHYWGYGIPYFHTPDTRVMYSFTPLRQTVVLLICAMHNEL